MSDATFQTRSIVLYARNSMVRTVPNLREFKTEILRKSIHLLIAFSPAMAALSHPATVVLLAAGTLGYIQLESLRLAGVRAPVVSALTDMASRSRDRGRFVLGPVTLGLGALLALVMYPLPAASIAIYALAFGDGLASLVGKFMGRLRPPFLRGKSVEGSLACFSAALITAYHVSHNWHIALAAALAAMITEALPLEDYDNLALPLVVGLVVSAIQQFPV